MIEKDQDLSHLVSAEARAEVVAIPRRVLSRSVLSAISITFGLGVLAGSFSWVASIALPISLALTFLSLIIGHGTRKIEAEVIRKYPLPEERKGD